MGDGFLPRRTSRSRSQLLQLVLVVLGALLSYFIISTFFLQSVRVDGASMSPTLHDSQHCFLNRWIFYVREPARGDIVVLRDPQDGGLAVKRIIGVSGDKVDLSNGPLLLNGESLDEPYLAPGTKTYPGPKYHSQSLDCGKGQYIVLGDNRNNSMDSRNYGPVPRQNILGLIIR